VEEEVVEEAQQSLEVGAVVEEVVVELASC